MGAPDANKTSPVMSRPCTSTATSNLYGFNLSLSSHHMRHIVGICSFLECASYSSRSQGMISST